MCNLINVNTWFSTPNWAYVEGTLCWSETDLICITPVRLVSWGRAEGRLGCECLNLRNCKIEMWMNYIMVEHSFTFSYSPPPQSKHEEFTLTNINICNTCDPDWPGALVSVGWSLSPRRRYGSCWSGPIPRGESVAGREPSPREKPLLQTTSIIVQWSIKYTQHITVM